MTKITAGRAVIPLNKGIPRFLRKGPFTLPLLLVPTSQQTTAAPGEMAQGAVTFSGLQMFKITYKIRWFSPLIFTATTIYS